MIEQELIKKSDTIFNDIDKWNAFLDLGRLKDQITGQWLRIGTERLREHFVRNPSGDWRWKPWGSPDRDTRWYLERFGVDSLAIGFWEYEFYLYVRDAKLDINRIDDRLKEVKYSKLLMPFKVQTILSPGPGNKAKEHRHFTFGCYNDEPVPYDELAWYAAHETEAFVKQAVSKIEQFTQNAEMTNLINELNAEAVIKPSTI